VVALGVDYTIFPMARVREEAHRVPAELQLGAGSSAPAA
jgi:hypothetical protein